MSKKKRGANRFTALNRLMPRYTVFSGIWGKNCQKKNQIIFFILRNFARREPVHAALVQCYPLGVSAKPYG